MAKAQAHPEQIYENRTIRAVHCDTAFVMYLKSWLHLHNLNDTGHLHTTMAAIWVFKMWSNTLYPLCQSHLDYKNQWMRQKKRKKGQLEFGCRICLRAVRAVTLHRGKLLRITVNKNSLDPWTKDSQTPHIRSIYCQRVAHKMITHFLPLDFHSHNKQILRMLE